MNHSIIRQHISTLELLHIYEITTSILIYTFAAPRIRSVMLLDRECLTLSKMDGLWDIKLKIPKTSNSNELETIKRPIPKVIWDFIDKYIDFIDSRHPNASTFWPSEFRAASELNEMTMRQLLDQFSDWIESPLYSGKRWYPRPHQFRRFFAAFSSTSATILTLSLCDGCWAISSLASLCITRTSHHSQNGKQTHSIS